LTAKHRVLGIEAGARRAGARFALGLCEGRLREGDASAIMARTVR